MLLGHEEPRIYTPPLRELTPDTTLGFEIIDFAEELGFKLVPWERWLLVHAFEILGDLDGEWTLRFRTVLVLIARQQGKTFLTTIITLYFLYILCVSLIIGTAQELDQAEEAWDACVDAIQSDDELRAEMVSAKYGNSGRRLKLGGNRRYITKASSRKAGRGKRAQLVIIDELREQTNWEAWNAISSTTLAQAKVGMLWCTSNAGDPYSLVLRHERFLAHMALGDPDGWCREVGDSLPPAVDDEGNEVDAEPPAIFEWSARPDRGIWDREGWCEANPSLGYGFLTERALAADIRNKEERAARTENLCQFVEAISEPPFPVGAWDAGIDVESEVPESNPVYFAVDVSEDRRHSAIAVCGQRADGDWHVEVVAYEPGIAWLESWLRDVANPLDPVQVAVQGRGAPASSMASVLDAIDGVQVFEVSGADVAGWCGRFWDAVSALDPDEGARSDATPVRHRPQAALDMAANVAKTRLMGDSAWAFDRKRSPVDISPLVACAYAHGLATRVPDQPKKKFESAYAERGVLTV